MDAALDLTVLRQKHPRFSYDKCEFQLVGNELQAKFFYTLNPDIHFTTQLTFHNVDPAHYQNLDQSVIANWIFQIGMVESLSYWKAACSPEFIISAGYLSTEQLIFWQQLLEKGLSEFFFINKIDGWAENFVKFTVTAPPQMMTLDQIEHQDRILLPVGGGKDSAVSIEVLKELQKPLATFTINTNDQIKKVLEVAQIPTHIEVTRRLDPQLLALNEQGYLNGHTPFSAMVSFVSTFAAYLYNYKYIALSNEWSANEGNTQFQGKTINHQYTKTIEYECSFRQYLERYVSPNVEYFSLLRPLHELQIAKIFSNYPQYFSAFLSCNRGQKTGKWCTECPKCLFVYIMLSPFLDPEKLLKIFGQDLLAKESLLPTLNELAGVTECKSFECVGTRQETILALQQALQKFSGKELPILLQHARNISAAEPIAFEEFMKAFQTNHFLPEAYVETVKKHL